MDLSALSPSRIKTTKDCEFKYFLQYHLRFPESRESNIYGLKGTAAHEALEFYGNFIVGSGDNQEEDVTKTLKDFYAKTKLWKLDNRSEAKGFPHPVAKVCESCPWATKDSMCEIANIPFKNVNGCPRPNFEDDLKIVKDTVDSTEYEIFKEKILGTEVKYFMELEGGVVSRGVIDLVIETDEDTLEIIDYKSGNSTLSYNAALKDPQMRIYSMVAKKLWPKYSTYMTSLYYIRKKKMLTVVFTDKDDEGTLKACQNHWRDIKKNKKPYRPGRSFWLCNFCVGYEACGQIEKNHTKNGRFILPTINCSNVCSDTECWGGVSPENQKEVTMFNTNRMTYACCGHIELHKGGEYVVKTDKNGW